MTARARPNATGGADEIRGTVADGRRPVVSARPATAVCATLPSLRAVGAGARDCGGGGSDGRRGRRHGLLADRPRLQRRQRHGDARAGRSTSRTCWSARCPTALLDLGDNQYDNGELANYPGRLRPDLRARELGRLPEPRQRRVRHRRAPRASSTTSRASASRPGSRASGATRRTSASGYYSFDIGTWHLIALNSNCADDRRLRRRHRRRRRG